MKNLPLVSVLIPAYNHAEYIEECIFSVISNDYANIEIIILDDGSTDDTFATIKNWVNASNNNGIRIYIERQENIGVTKTLNKLIGLSKGEFIILLASDDKLTRDSISVRVDALLKNPQWMVVFGDCYLIDNLSMLKSGSGLRDIYNANTDALLDKNKLARELILKWCVPGPVTMARQAAYSIPYDESLIVEDRDWYLRFLGKGEVGFLDKPVAYYRLHEKNTISDPLKKIRLASDLARSEKKHISTLTGLNRFLLRLIYQRNKDTAEFYRNPNPYNRTKLFGSKSIAWLAYKLNVLL